LVKQTQSQHLAGSSPLQCCCHLAENGQQWIKWIASDVESIGISDVIPVIEIGPGAIRIPDHL
jgi:hypothetical protein